MLPPLLDEDERDECRVFIRYLLIFSGFGFTLLFSKAISLYLQYDILQSTYTVIVFFTGICLFFGVHFWCMIQFILAYTLYDLFTFKNWRLFIRYSFHWLILIALSHTLVCISFHYLEINKGGFLEPDRTTDYHLYIFVDLALLFTLAILIIWYKVFGKRSILSSGV
ncbi:MAG: hypothetical protein JXA92_01110 [candidate division Zixibacteria bacterium]|nr:hypothetical protein [candidate division Zixibacteria bacterium]